MERLNLLGRLIDQTGEIHYGKLYSPLHFSAKSVIGIIEEDNDRRQPMAVLCHHMDICEVVAMVHISELKIGHKTIYNLSSNNLYEASAPWFLVQGNQYNDSESIFLIVNEREEFYPIFKFKDIRECDDDSLPMLPYFILSERKLACPNQSWVDFSSIDRALVLEAIGIYLRENYH